MKNKYLQNLNKIEFVLTYACTGRCKHCSEGDHESCGELIDPAIAADAVRRVAAEYDIKTVMTFGGEPLLHTEAVYAIMRVATKMNVPKRQLITNGYFTTEDETMRRVAAELAECGVNDLLLSVDAFHQETIPIAVVKRFAEYVKRSGIPIRLQPAWLVSAEDSNPYNQMTRAVLSEFDALDIPHSAGNVVFPEGNAKKFLAEYFTQVCPENPYVEDSCDVRSLSFSPDGDVLGGNVYKQDIIDILKNYAPCVDDKRLL